MAYAPNCSHLAYWSCRYSCSSLLRWQMEVTNLAGKLWRDDAGKRKPGFLGLIVAWTLHRNGLCESILYYSCSLSPGCVGKMDPDSRLAGERGFRERGRYWSRESARIWSRRSVSVVWATRDVIIPISCYRVALGNNSLGTWAVRGFGVRGRTRKRIAQGCIVELWYGSSIGMIWATRDVIVRCTWRGGIHSKIVAVVMRAAKFGAGGCDNRRGERIGIARLYYD
jgi:hypothetical protein